MINKVAVIGAGNGGRAAAADLALQGKRVRLFEFPDYRGSIAGVMATSSIAAQGAVEGVAELDLVTCDMGEAVEGADLIMVCTQAGAHSRAARELAPLVEPDCVVMLNPGSCGGSLLLAHVFRQAGVSPVPVLAETSTLTYGCRGGDGTVTIYLKVARVVYGTLPATAASNVGPVLESMYPGLVRGASVLEAGLNNANPVIHPPITILNAARIEKQGRDMLFYADGLSPTVARVIEQLDRERMALLRALGYPAQSDPETSVQQGYATSTGYLECYSQGEVFRQLRSPGTLDNRYLHEDVGIGLLMFSSLGTLLRVPTPTCDAIIQMAGAIAGRDYAAEGGRTLDALGIGDLSVDALKAYLETGRAAE